MRFAEAIPLPLPHIKSVNAWLLPGRPTTLVDTGPRSDEALTGLESALAARGLRIEDIELILGTHHHLDHVGLVETIRRRSGAQVAMLAATAEYAAEYRERVAADRRFSEALMTAHGVPRRVIDDDEAFWRFIDAGSEPFSTDVRLSDGDRIRAGGRDLRIVARPGHSTTDTLYIDDTERTAIVGDHLLATVSSNTEIYPADAFDPPDARPASRVTYLDNLRRTATMGLARLHTGHGSDITDIEALVRTRLRQHAARCERIAFALAGGHRTAYEIAGELWSPSTVREQPLLVTWEVLGHLDLMADDGRVSEVSDTDGLHYFALRSAVDTMSAPSLESK